MPTKKKKPTTKRKAPQKPDPQEYHLLGLIKATERSITDQGTDIDEFFKNQLARLKRQLEEHYEKKKAE